MTEHLKKIFDSTTTHLVRLCEKIKDDKVEEIKLTENFSVEDFCLKFENVAEGISRAATEIAMAFTVPPVPSIEETQEMMKKIETASDCLVSLYGSFPTELGNYFHHDVYKLVVNILLTLEYFVFVLGVEGSKDSNEKFKEAEVVFDACEDVKEMPKNNLESIIKLLNGEETSVLVALLDIDYEVMSDFLAQKFGSEVDNTEIWNNQDKELLPPCIALVKSARSSLKQVKYSMSSNGDCKTFENIAELDSVGVIVEDLMTAVDSLVATIHRPMNQQTVKTAARVVVNVIQKLLNRVQEYHFVTEDDQKWLDFLLKAVDYNNNKLHPLLSQEKTNDCDDSDA